MNRIDWSWEDIDASEITGSTIAGSLELPNGDVLRWSSISGYRRYFVNHECIYDPTETDKLTLIAALAVENILNNLEGMDEH